MEDGWVEYVDPASGHPYLYHAESGESRWVVAKPPEPPAGSPNGHANGASYAAAAPHDAAASAVFKPVNVPALPREFSPKAVMDFGLLTPEESRARGGSGAAPAPVEAMRD